MNSFVPATISHHPQRERCLRDALVRSDTMSIIDTSTERLSRWWGRQRPQSGLSSADFVAVWCLSEPPRADPRSAGLPSGRRRRRLPLAVRLLAPSPSPGLLLCEVSEWALDVQLTKVAYLVALVLVRSRS
jgi:hypothetical protein